MKISVQFLLFAAIGAVGTCAHFVVLIALVQGAGMSPVLATAFGFVVGAIVNYLLNHRFAFGGRADHRVAAGRFLAVALVGAQINTAAMWVLTTWCALNYLLAQVLATGLVLGINFALSRWWVFRAPAHGGGSST